MLSAFAVLTREDREGSMATGRRFDRLVVIKTRGAGTAARIGSVREAANCLIASEWPRPHGPKYIAAVRACHDALAGEVTTEAARQAFIAAAAEAGILIGEKPLRG